MPHVRLSEQASIDLSRLYTFLAKHDVSIADRAIETIIASFSILEELPTGFPLLPNRKDLRKLVIHFGESGYVAFYNYNELTDVAIITKIQHQREHYESKTL